MSAHPRTRQSRAVGAACVVVLLAGCSNGAEDVGVRTAANDADVVDVRTDASTTTSPAAPPDTRARGDDTDSSGDDAQTGPAGSPDEALVAPVEAAPAGATLGEALLRDGPRGWQAEPETLPDLGPLTPAEAAAAVGDPDGEAALLETRRLRLAYARRWRAANGTTATLVGYAFADAEGALAYEVDSYLAIVGGGADEMTPVDGARGFTIALDGAVLHGRSLRVQERLYVIIVRGAADDDAVADALLGAQRQRLGLA